MSARLFLAVLTRERCIRILGESFGIELIGDFPYQKKQQRKTEQAPGVIVRYENKRGKHHCIVPVVYSTVGTAFVL